MTLPTIRARRYHALILDRPLSQALYGWELAEHISFWRKEIRRDRDDFLLVMTEKEDDVALPLLDKKGWQFVNEDGRQELRRRWSALGVYKHNMLLLIPDMDRQLHDGDS